MTISDRDWKAFVVYKESKDLGFEFVPPLKVLKQMDEKELDEIMDRLKEMYVSERTVESMKELLKDIDKHGKDYAIKKHIGGCVNG